MANENRETEAMIGHINPVIPTPNWTAIYHGWSKNMAGRDDKMKSNVAHHSFDNSQLMCEFMSDSFTISESRSTTMPASSRDVDR